MKNLFTRIKLWYIYWRGRNRIALGFCPNCNSSPPDHKCTMCYGTTDYGAEMNPKRRMEWRYQWDYRYRKATVMRVPLFERVMQWIMSKQPICQACKGTGFIYWTERVDRITTRDRSKVCEACEQFGRYPLNPIVKKILNKYEDWNAKKNERYAFRR